MNTEYFKQLYYRNSECFKHRNNERIIISFELIYNMFFDLLSSLTLNERDLPFTKYLESNHETEGCEGQTFNLPEKYRWKK